MSTIEPGPATGTGIVLMEHVNIARDVLREHYGDAAYSRLYGAAEAGMDALRALASFVLALHPELASGDEDARDEATESLIEVINGEIDDDEYLARVYPVAVV